MNEAIRLLGVYTAGRFDIWALAGSSRASCRAHVMSALKGHKVPQSQSGVTALREEFCNQARAHGAVIDGDCIAVREDQFIAWCRMQS
jgi:hypothetical protein